MCKIVRYGSWSNEMTFFQLKETPFDLSFVFSLISGGIYTCNPVRLDSSIVMLSQTGRHLSTFSLMFAVFLKMNLSVLFWNIKQVKVEHAAIFLATHKRIAYQEENGSKGFSEQLKQALHVHI